MSGSPFVAAMITGMPPYCQFRQDKRTAALITEPPFTIDYALAHIFIPQLEQRFLDFRHMASMFLRL